MERRVDAQTESPSFTRIGALAAFAGVRDVLEILLRENFVVVDSQGRPKQIHNTRVSWKSILLGD